jgi:predicted ATPase
LRDRQHYTNSLRAFHNVRVRPSARSKENYQTLSAELKGLVKKTLQKEPAATGVGLPGRILGNASEQTTIFFSRKIRYLGPLRDEPRSLYPLHTTADPLDVGLHGEFTAAVFHNFQRTDVRYIPSIHFANDSDDKKSTTTNLRQAVFDWLAYLDVASKVDTRDEGKLGHGLSVFLEGSKAGHDLPHVGVGVSQVLPIVVMCLLAGPDTTAIIEQPELHLNPKVQTRLADFFLSMALVGNSVWLKPTANT